MLRATDDVARLPAVAVENLGKRYGARGRLRSTRTDVGLRAASPDEVIVNDDDLDVSDPAVSPDTPAAPNRRSEIWALRGISFDVETGAALGIIGPNGSGKSTLVRTLARMTPPTEGRAVLRGRVAPLVDLAVSLMNGDLTGRSNVHLLSEFLRAPRELADERMAEIGSFAELGDLLEAPVRKYSSGSVRRLVFSAVLNLDPAIFLADETLAVGDSAFRARCIDRIVDLIKHDRLTLLFASHDMSMVRRICDEVLWLDGGTVVERGPADEVIDRYAGRTASPRPRRQSTMLSRVVEMPSGVPLDRSVIEQARSKDHSFNEHAAVYSAGAFTADGEPTEALSAHDHALLQVAIEVAASGIGLRCGIAMVARKGVGIRFLQPETTVCDEPGLYVATVNLAPGKLREGLYIGRAGAFVTKDGVQAAITRHKAFMVDVSESDGWDVGEPSSRGAFHEVTDHPWTVERVE